MSRIFLLEPWTLAVCTIAVYLGIGLCGLFVLRTHVRRMAGDDVQLHNSVTASIFSACSTFCGLLLGLIAVTAWRAHSDAASLVTKEATTLAALFRDMGDYPEPVRSELRTLTKEYVRHVIEDAWPVQRQCKVPSGGGANALFKKLAAFNPSNPREVAEHQEAMRAFNIFFEARRERLDAVAHGLPAQVWFVVLISGVVVISLTWFFIAPALRTQVVLTSALSTVVGLLVFLIAALDRPFCGPMGIDATSFELVRNQLMKD